LLGGFVGKPFGRAEVFGASKEAGVGSEKNRTQRKRAEAALASTVRNLERSNAIFGRAFASVEKVRSPFFRPLDRTLLSREDFKQEIYEELSALLHQTHRLTGVMTSCFFCRAWTLVIFNASTPVNLSQLIESGSTILARFPIHLM